MIYIDEIKDLRLYKKPFLLPRYGNDKKKNNAIFLLTPNIECSMSIINHPLMINKYYHGYFLDRDVSLYINEHGNLSRIPEDEEIVHETDEVINEGIYSNRKAIYFNGYSNNVANARRYISVEMIEAINKETLNARIKWPISVTIYPSRKQKTLNTDSRSIYLKCYEDIGEDYAIYCKEEIIKLLIHTINENVSEDLCECIAMVLSGGYDKFREEFYELDALQKYIVPCNGIVSILKKSNGMHEVYKMIEKNKAPKAFEKGIKSVFEASDNATDIKKLTRKIKRSARKGSKYVINKLGRDVTRTVDPHEKTPDMTSSDYNSNMADINIADIKNSVKSGAKAPTVSVTQKEQPADESSYDTKAYELFLSESSIENETISEDYTVSNGIITFFNEDSDNYSGTLKKILYRERIKNNKAIIPYYDQIKQSCPAIKNTYLSYKRYKSFNIFVDLFYYNQLYFKNSMYVGLRGFNLYKAFLYKLINNKNFVNSGYNQKKTIMIPIPDWSSKPDTKMWMYTKDINPISIIYKLMKDKDFKELKRIFGNSDLVFLSKFNYFKLNFSNILEKDESRATAKFISLIRKVLINDNIELPEDEDIEDGKADSKKAIVNNIIDDIEDNSNIKISTKNLTGEENKDQNDKTDKDKLIEKINKAAEDSEDTSVALDKLQEDDEFKKLLLTIDMNDEEKSGPVLNTARKNRIEKLDNEFMEKKVKGMTVKDILNKREELTEIPLEPVSLNVDSINPEWKELTYPSITEQYDPDSDIIASIRNLINMTYPISTRGINIEDNSTSEDYICTYTVDFEYYNGKRSKFRFDVPKLKNNKYMMLRGNKKNISSQSFLVPLIKTDSNDVQIVSNYSKIFVSRFGTSKGKSNMYTDFIFKAFNKYKGTEIKVTEGDNSVICQRYNLPVDFIDLATYYSKIETPSFTIYFNIEDIEKNTKEKIDWNKGVPFGIENSSKGILYYNERLLKDEAPLSFSLRLLYLLEEDGEFRKIISTLKPATKYTYSKASIMSTEIPVIVLCAYSEGLTKVLNKSGIKYDFVEKITKDNFDKLLNDKIKFSDGYLVYTISPTSTLLMNGLKECNTENYSIGDINKKSTYVDFIENFGGRLKCDGLDNFYDCMIDPITRSILSYKNLPTDYVELLLYANNLLVDNSFISNGDMRGRRLRRNELIAAYAYKCISSAYGRYATDMKHGRDSIMTMKQSAIIDAILTDNTTSDLSILNALGEKEAYDTVSYKGLSGMNNDRSYSLDKRGYDKSMINVLGMSTGFAGTVGINRQATINSNIDTVRGFIKPPKKEEMNSVNSLCMSEALTPMGTTRDDPFRTAMTYVQTTKHGMRVKQADPLLVTNGADEALPYLISDVFAFKAKNKGKVLEITDDYILVEYSGGKKDYINIANSVEKNSSAGFYVSVKLDTDLKVGSTFKKNDIIAYDKSSFKSNVGINTHPAYKIGTLAKCVMMDTSEGFEDSTCISTELAEAMSNSVIVAKEVNLDRNTNIYNILKKGDPVQEGDILMTIQTPYDEEDANMLLKNLVDDPEEISNLGRIPIKSKVTGVIEDIKIYRTVELEELSDSLQKLCKSYEKDIKSKKSVMKSNQIDKLEELDADYKLPPTGKLKNTDGVKIIFYLRYYDRMSIGDKLINWSANKGVVKYIIPEGKEPYCLSTPQEKVHCLVSVSSCNGRMVASIQNIGVINNLLVEATRKAKLMAGLPISYDLLRKDDKK